MKIKWNGHASFTITSDNGTVIVTDPFDPAAYGGVLKYRKVDDKADVALVSHDHADHNYVQGLTGSPEVLTSSGKVRDIKILGINAYHDASGGSERGTNTVFAFEVDKVRICFAGDLGHQLSGAQIDSIGKVDLLLAPVGGTFTLDSEGAFKLTEAIRPRVAIPMHFKTDKCNLPIAGLDAFLEKMAVVKRMYRSEIEVSVDHLPAGETEVWVLDHAC